MKNTQYSIWGNFKDKRKEKKFIAFTLSEIRTRNRIGIFVGSFAFLLVGVSDIARIGFCNQSFITLSIRLLLFLYALYIYISWKRKATITNINVKSVIFTALIGNLITLIIFLLNEDKTIDIVDLLTVPFTYILVYVFINIPSYYILLFGIITSVFYLIVISLFPNIDSATIFILSTILLAMNIMGFYINRFLAMVRRTEFTRIQEIRILNNDLQEEVEERKSIQEKLTYAYSEITESIHYANHLQMTMLPDLSILRKHVTDYFNIYLPCDILSGDFYWLSTPKDKIIVAVADCTGHGIRAAFLSIVGISLLDDIVKNKKIIHANEILEYLRCEIMDKLKQTDSESTSHDGMDIALCVIDTKKMIMEYAGAYNPILHLSNNKLNEYKGDRMPVSNYIAAKPHFTNNEIKISKGDKIYLFSDGYADQFGGVKNKKFNLTRLKNEILNTSNLPMDAQKHVLESMHVEWKGIYPQTDDVLLMGIEI